MTDLDHDRVKDVFLEACLRPPAARPDYLSEACAGSDHVLREVQSLLSFYQGEEEERAPRIAVQRRAPRARFRREQVVGGRFRVERMLGRGGMGEVYAAFDLVLGVPVALKTLRGRQDAHRARLLEEVRLARQVSHPGICRVYDVGEHGDTPFLTMELILGEDLATRLERTGPWASQEIAALGASLGDALAAAHEAGILHRDLKPGNLLIDRDGGLHVSDFGVASILKSASDGNDGTGPRGTLAYMAPEALDPRAELTEQSDLYSMGVVLYELATGAPVFDASDASVLREMHRSQAPEPPSRRRPGLDQRLEDWILRLLAKDRAARPPSARAVADGLRSLQGAAGSEPAALVDEERTLVAMLCEIDPTLAIESREDREQVGILQARWARICVENGGRVARRLERGLLVHFGLARSGEHDVETAVRAGLEILDAAARTAPDSISRIRAGVSINAGTAVLRAMRAGVVAMSGGVDDVETLRRLLAQGTVVVSAKALPLLRDAVAARTLVTATPRAGAAGGAAVYRYPRREAGIEAHRPGQTPFAGRGLELAQLLARWEDARAGMGQAVLLSGDPGVGKSRLVQELWGRIAGEAEGLEVQCRGFYRSSPLQPFLDLLRRAAEIADADDNAARSVKLAALLGPLGNAGADTHATFEAWLTPAASVAANAVDGAARQAAADSKRFRRALADWLFALAEEKPLLLVVDDVHWSDPTSLEAIDLLVDECGAARLLLIVSTRPIGPPRWHGSHVSAIALQSLRPDEARTLATSVGTGLALPQRTVERVVTSAAGNPLFLEELVRHAREVGDAGRLSTTTTEGVPLTIRSLLQTRLDTLGPAKRIAQAAAVCGRSFRHDVLEAMLASEPGIELAEGLERLREAKVVHQRGTPPTAAYTFRHPLLADAAYASMPLRQRRTLHAELAELTPSMDAEGTTARPEVVATHWMLAGQPARAFPWWRRAGHRALERSAFAEATSDFEQARRDLRSWARAEAIDSPEVELELLVGITSAQMALRFLTTDLRPVLARIRSLCRGSTAARRSSSRSSVRRDSSCSPWRGRGSSRSSVAPRRSRRRPASRD